MHGETKTYVVLFALKRSTNPCLQQTGTRRLVPHRMEAPPSALTCLRTSGLVRQADATTVGMDLLKTDVVIMRSESVAQAHKGSRRKSRGRNQSFCSSLCRRAPTGPGVKASRLAAAPKALAISSQCTMIRTRMACSS
mmetsp:Transcript_62570/g.145669  ORF Transcript_62570/g.145669 Transcript_62570/m.145669 type:complete len:138 (-) Transcript_62570:69-482(-)